MVDLGQGIEVPAGPPAAMWTATLQALARRTAAAADRVGALAGPPRRLVVFGGGSRSPVWLRAKIAEMGCPVVTCPDAGAAARARPSPPGSRPAGEPIVRGLGSALVALAGTMGVS